LMLPSRRSHAGDGPAVDVKRRERRERRSEVSERAAGR